MLIPNRHQFPTALAIITTVASIFVLRPIPSSDGPGGIPKSNSSSERYYSETVAYQSQAGLLTPAAGNDAEELQVFLANWSDGSGRQLLHTASLTEVSRSDGEDGKVLSPARLGSNDRPEGDFFREDRFERITPPLPANQNGGSHARDGSDLFVPLPPPGKMDSEIDAILTGRYQNPMTVRAIRAIGRSQAEQLLAEVYQKIDERSLEPTSNHIRVRRALRNLTLALENEAFVSGFGLPENSLQLHALKNTLYDLADADRVRDYQDVVRIFNTIVNQAQGVKGLTPGVVGCEFAFAGLDTLDKFSGLELTESVSRNGVQSDGLSRTSDLLNEQIVGIGLEVREHPNGLVVVRPLRGGPAAEAGIRQGDIIRSIDGRDLRGMKLGSSIDLLKGAVGSQMKIRLYHDGGTERDLVLTRRTVRVWTVNDAKLVSGTKVGYFSLSRFSQNSTAEVTQALNRLHDQGMESLIIDLRGNPGGLLTTCVEISDLFVPCGTIVSTRGRLSVDSMFLEATYSNTWRVPIAVLIDGDSASASEIFAAALQDNKRGVIIGTNSYGKGTVQTHFPLRSVEGSLRLTTAMFYSPDGRTMAGEGVTPDIEVLDLDDTPASDEVLAEALKMAQNPLLKEMAKAAGMCRSQHPPAARSSSLEDIRDPRHPGTTIL